MDVTPTQQLVPDTVQAHAEDTNDLDEIARSFEAGLSPFIEYHQAEAEELTVPPGVQHVSMATPTAQPDALVPVGGGVDSVEQIQRNLQAMLVADGLL